MKQVAIIGINGVPARYGGFETMVENIIGDNCSPEVQYTVFCSTCGLTVRPKTYKGCLLRYIRLRPNGIWSIPYDIVSMMRAMWKYDTVLVLGMSGALFLPILKLFSRAKIIINVDGIEHRRDKWGKFTRWFLRLSEQVAVRAADVIVADNLGIQNYITETYHKPSVLIAYGGDHSIRDVSPEKQASILEQYGLTACDYAVSICRIEPENNVHITLQAFAGSNRRLVFVGNWQHSAYSRELWDKYGAQDNITLLNAIYDLDILYVIRANAAVYIHGHKIGGTNPSLVEAMFFGRPIVAYDVIYNRATTNNEAYYFADSAQLLTLLSATELNGEAMVRYATENYRWELIAKQYEALY